MIPFLLLTLLAAPPAESEWTEGLRLNQLQVIGSHNSYKAPIEPALLRVLTAASQDAEAFDYAHPPLADQLDLGVRGLELDIYHDPTGGHYTAPRGLEFLRTMGVAPEPYDPDGAMQEPGFKVMHVADVDFRSNCPTLALALRSLRSWSERHPNHLPIVITMNLKDEPTPFPGSTEPVAFDGAAFDALDIAIRTGLGNERLLTPDQVRGEEETLNAAIRQRGWPLIDDVRGRFLWVLDEGNPKQAAYLEGHPSLAGRVLFTTSPPGRPESAFLVMNHPQRQEAEIRRLVGEGYLVRTRADAETREARRGDTTRFDAALRSGAQVISTDYPRADKRLGTGYRVVFDGGTYARRNPITAEPAPQ